MNNKITILINGSTGKMGQIAVHALQEHPEFEIVGTLCRKDNLAEKIRSLRPQVAVDLTNAAVVHDNIAAFIETNTPAIIGTTGLLSSDIEIFKNQCAEKKLGMIFAPNFSIGALLMMKYAEDAARYFHHVEIIEMHHAQKAEAPSGTAIKTAQLIAEKLTSEQPLSCREIIPGVRGGQSNDITIHSIRLPGKIAHQQVIFGSIGETLTLQHDTTSRECFMPGLILACKTVLQLDHFVDGLEKILFQEKP